MRLLHTLDSDQVEVSVQQVEKAEIDEMWSVVGSKRQQRWLWHAIDHYTGQTLAYVCGAREDDVFLELQVFLKSFGITHFSTDGWGAYRRHSDHDNHTVGKRYTQKIERKHTTLRARIKRLARKTICFCALFFCMIWSLACSSIAMSLDMLCKTYINGIKTSPPMPWPAVPSMRFGSTRTAG